VSPDRLHNLDSILSHAVQEDKVEQVAVVGHGADLLGYIDGDVKGIDTITGNHDPHALQVTSVGPEAQVHG
jgi:hypothetical protein